MPHAFVDGFNVPKLPQSVMGYEYEFISNLEINDLRIEDALITSDKKIIMSFDCYIDTGKSSVPALVAVNISVKSINRYRMAFKTDLNEVMKDLIDKDKIIESNKLRKSIRQQLKEYNYADVFDIMRKHNGDKIADRLKTLYMMEIIS